MFSKSAKFYDELYASMDKDYAAETRALNKFIRQHKKAPGKSLLEAACGTGVHASHLSRHYSVEALDLDYEMLKVAKRNYPHIRFHHGDMVDFHLGRQFDILTCLFSSIGYVQTKTRLRKAIQNMADHLVPGGILIIEPWFSPDQWSVGRVGMLSLERSDHTIVRVSRSGRRGKLSLLNFEYLIGTPKRIEHRSETHKLGLFTDEEYRSAFRAAKLDVTHDPKGLDGRGLYIGLKPLE